MTALGQLTSKSIKIIVTLKSYCIHMCSRSNLTNFIGILNNYVQDVLFIFVSGVTISVRTHVSRYVML